MKESTVKKTFRELVHLAHTEYSLKEPLGKLLLAGHALKQNETGEDELQSFNIAKLNFTIKVLLKMPEKLPLSSIEPITPEVVYTHLHAA